METRDRIISKSIELFVRFGIRYVTMDQIAAELGISKRTIYELFKDKDDLLLQCIEEMGKRNNRELHDIVVKSENVIEALYMIGQHGEKKKAAINPLFFDDIGKLYPHLLKIFIKKQGPGHESVSYTILKKGTHQGIFRKELNLDIVDVFIHEMMKICHDISIFPEDSNSSGIIKNIVIPYFRGISTDKGKELIEKHFPFNNNNLITE